MKHNLRHLHYINNSLDSGNICPACPKVYIFIIYHCLKSVQLQSGGKIVYAMDGLFGLPRKKAAGVSYKAPLLGSLFFGEQSDVDQFIADNTKSKVLPTVSQM